MHQSNSFVSTRSRRSGNSFSMASLLILMLLVLDFTQVMGQGNLLIMPRRVVLEGNKKSQELTLANTGRDTARYSISFVQMRMKEDGSFEPITSPDSGQMFADKYVRFFPRTVSLPPNQSQVIKLQLNKGVKMADGEYRSHIYFRAVKTETPLGDSTRKDSSSLSVRLTPVFGITIPAIVRVGPNTMKVVIAETDIEYVNDTTTKLKLDFHRTGNCSVYGDIIVNHTSPDGKVNKVALVKGVAVYTPNELRKFQCNLDRIPGIDFHKGKLSVVYVAPEDVKATKYAEAELALH